MAQPRKSDKSRHFAAGFVSGIGSAVVLQPLDLLKTRAQQSGNHDSLMSNLKSVLRPPSGKAGLLGLWRGTVPSTIRTGVGSAIYFSLLNSLRQHSLQFNVLRDHNRHPTAHSSNLPVLSNTANLVTGATARIMAGLVLMPLTIIKVRFESNLYSYRSIWGAARDIYAAGGVGGFFSGFGATALRDGPYAGMYVLFYEGLKKQLSHMSVARRPSATDFDVKLEGRGTRPAAPAAAVINFSSAILAGSACSVVSNPFDAVKTRIQLEPHSYKNMAQACRKMLAADGIRSLFDGLALRMTRKALSSALAWTVYEELIRTTRHVGVGTAHDKVLRD